MRVISGLYKGRRLQTVNDLSVRPATDRVKQTLFDMLANRIELENATILDLFAGSGSLGIEALSRGAAHVTFVESNARAAEFIGRNLGMLGCEDQASIIESDALSFAQRCRDSFDLIFADPPYTHEETREIPDVIFGARLLSEGGYLLIEHTTDMRFASNELYRTGPEKRFGRTVVTFFRHHTHHQEQP